KPEAGATYAPGLIFPQLQGMELKKLLGSAYNKSVRDKFIEEWGPRSLYVVTDPNADKIKGPLAKGGEKFDSIYMTPRDMRKDMRICAKIGVPFSLSPEHQRFLELGEATEFAYKQLSFPAWFSQGIFVSIMGNRARLLTELSEVLKADPKSNDAIAK